MTTYDLRNLPPDPPAPPCAPVSIERLGDPAHLHAAGPWRFGWDLSARTPPLVARVGGRIVGYLVDSGAAIICMEVRPAFQGSGIGRALVEVHRSRYRRVRAYGVEWDAEGFWQILGFVKGREDVWTWTARPGGEEDKDAD